MEYSSLTLRAGLGLLLPFGSACSAPPTNPWLVEDEDANWSWAGVVVVEQEGGEVVYEAHGDGELPDLDSLDDLQLGSGSFRWFSAEGGKLQPLVGLTGLYSGPGDLGDIHFVDFVSSHSGSEVEHVTESHPPGIELRWAHRIDGALGLSFEGTNQAGTVSVSFGGEEEDDEEVDDAFELALDPWADADGSADVHSLAWINRELFVALLRTDGPGGPPSEEGPLLLQIAGESEIEELQVAGQPELIAPAYGGHFAAVILDSGPQWSVHDLGCEGAVCPARFDSTDLPDGSSVPRFVASDRGHIVAFVDLDGETGVFCSEAGSEDVFELAVLSGAFRHAHWAPTGLLTVALAGDEGGGSLWMLHLNGCVVRAAPQTLDLDGPVVGVALTNYSGPWP
jgi:hypothetical protein